MADLKSILFEILDNTYLMSLATCDNNKPWVADVVFVYSSKLDIYWLSKSSTRHSKNLEVNPNVSATITMSNNQGESNKGLQIEGRAFLIEGLIPEMAIKHLAKRKKKDLDFKNILNIRNERWYKLVPENIEIIYEPLFGFEKQNYSLNNN